MFNTFRCWDIEISESVYVYFSMFLAIISFGEMRTSARDLIRFVRSRGLIDIVLNCVFVKERIGDHVLEAQGTEVLRRQ